MNRTLPFLMLLVLGLVQVPASAQAEPLKIGAILHLTGDQAMQGAAFREGIELAVSEVNQNGGVNSSPLSVIFEDSKLSPKEAHGAAKKLLHQDHVVAAIDASFLEIMANGALFEQAKVPVIVLWDSSPQIEALGDYVFGIGIWTPSAGETAARFAHEQLRAKTAIIINTENEWSKAVSEYFTATFAKRGGKVLESYSLPPSTNDFRTILSKARSKKPEVIYSPITDNVVAFYKQAKELGLRADIPFISSDIINHEHILAAPASFEGLYQTQAPDAGLSLSRKYEQHFQRPLTQALLTSFGYDAVLLLARSMKLCAANRECIKKKLYSLEPLSGASQNIAFTQAGSSPVQEEMFRIENAKFILSAP